MLIFDQIIILSKQIATSLLKDREPTNLRNSELFKEEDKEYILNNLTNDFLIKEHLLLVNKIDKKGDWKKVESRIEVSVHKLYWRYIAAAIIVIALTSTYFLSDSVFNSNKEIITPIIVDNQIMPGNYKAILTLETGETVALEKGKVYHTQNANSTGEEITYDITGINKKEIVYNTLTIPRGGQFKIKLSDGTLVWLNSESQLKYPVNFVDGESRQVELVYGEAYFEVSHSVEHKGSHFKVHNNAQDIEVLGTKFNIKAYKDENHIYTTLVEGKVALQANKNHRVLVPGEQLNLNKESQSFIITTPDIKPEISWREGLFSFKGKTLKEIMKVLERWYDMDVVFENKSLENAEFIGVVRKNQDIEEIMSLIKSITINNYEIHGKMVILK